MQPCSFILASVGGGRSWGNQVGAPNQMCDPWGNQATVLRSVGEPRYSAPIRGDTNLGCSNQWGYQIIVLRSVGKPGWGAPIRGDTKLRCPDPWGYQGGVLRPVGIPG